MTDRYETIEVTKEQGITFVTFNRPDKPRHPDLKSADEQNEPIARRTVSA